MRLRGYAASLALAGLVFLGLGLVRAVAQDAAEQSPLSIPGVPSGAFRNRLLPPPIRLDPKLLAELKTHYVPPIQVPYPADNSYSANKELLGRKLFFDPSLSANGNIACASCHNVRHGFSGGMAFSVGVQGKSLARHSPTILNLAWADAYFWDGRAKTLEQQALMPIAEPKEMGTPHDVLVSKLAADPEYRRLFDQAFPGEGVNAITVGKALAVFERTLSFADSPFDRWVAGDETAISDSAKRGFIAFNTRAGCAQCHSGWNFTDGKFHDIGVRGSDDIGRFGVESDDSLKHAFKTPGLRDIALRAPYMHNGRLSTLAQVVEFYNGDFIRRSTLAPEMSRVRVGGNATDIFEFLLTLTSPMPTELVRLQDALDAKTGAPGLAKN